MIGDLVQFLGRPLFWMLTITLSLCLCVVIAVSVAALQPFKPTPPSRIITPQQAVNEGCCLVHLSIFELSYEPARAGKYAIETVAGRAPETASGAFTPQTLWIEFFVGGDWVGRVVVKPERCVELPTTIFDAHRDLTRFLVPVENRRCG